MSQELGLPVAKAMQYRPVHSEGRKSMGLIMLQAVPITERTKLQNAIVSVERTGARALGPFLLTCSNAAPHLVQNRRPSGYCVPQLGQNGIKIRGKYGADDRFMVFLAIFLPTHDKKLRDARLRSTT